MSEGSSVPEKSTRQHPTAETITHLRHQINERIPQATKIFEKSGTEPTRRELINSAGDQLRREMESDFDPLTGVLNLIGYNKRKNQVLASARNNQVSLTAVAIDLDDLKKINDTKGHAEGDNYLRNAADALRDVTRLTDLVARKGGDEFEVLLIGTDNIGAEQWERRARESFDAKSVKASFGVSMVDPFNPDDSFREADQRMYVEKRAKHPTEEHLSVLQRIAKPVLRILGRAA